MWCITPLLSRKFNAIEKEVFCNCTVAIWQEFSKKRPKQITSQCGAGHKVLEHVLDMSQKAKFRSD